MEQNAHPQESKPTKTPTIKANLVAILFLLFFFPVGLYIMWTKTNWHKKVKWGISGIFGFLTLIMFINSLSGMKQESATTQSLSPTIVAQETNRNELRKEMEAQISKMQEQLTNSQTKPETPKLTPTFTPTPTEMQYDANGFPADAERITVSDLAKVPSAYEGKKIAFTCNVVSFPKDDNGNASGINCSDPNDYTSIIQVNMGAFDQSVKVNTNDTVVVYGMGQGAAQGKNAFGADVTEAVVLEYHLKDLATGYSE